jgi:ABC-2 type transport system ATP-binding protein
MYLKRRRIVADAPVIWAQGLTKRYGDNIALAGIDLAIPAGTIFGLLGPNGAGKSTIVRILTTLAVPGGGRATVAGHDVVTEAMAVRRAIGVTAQDATVDEMLTGRRNLVMIGRLAGLGRREAKDTAAELLERFGLSDAADRVLKGYSGGMRRRLDLAAAIVARPPVLFLDEPTTGLDPVSRQVVWEIVRSLVADGTTVLLTTQYLDEADQLADRIAVIDHGRIVAEGTACDLKARVGGARMEISLSEPAASAAELLVPFASGPVTMDDDGLRLRAGVAGAGGTTGTTGLATAVVRAFDAAGIVVDDIEVRQPSLDDVFLALTGHGSPAADGSPAAAGAAR